MLIILYVKMMKTLITNMTMKTGLTKVLLEVFIKRKTFRTYVTSQL